jgi:hypothetical protein
MSRSGRAADRRDAAADRLVQRVIDARRAVAAAQAAEAAVLAEAMDWAVEVSRTLPRPTSRDSEMVVRDLAAQIGTGIRLSDRSVQAHMSTAYSVIHRFPATYAAWRGGSIDRAHVTVITEAGAPISDDDAREWFERQVLVRALTLTPAQLRPVARSLAEHAHPESLEDRHRRARAGRRVTVRELDDGMAQLLADLPAPLAHGILDRLSQQARHLLDAAATAAEEPVSENAAGADGACGEPVMTGGSRVRSHGAETRTMDELRADILSDLLLTAAPAAHGANGDLADLRGHVQVTVPVLTAVGASKEPAVLAGYGPIPLAVAQELAGTASGWDRVMTHPTTGAVLAVDRYRPSAQLRRFLQARDEHCRFPGCRQAVWRCDIDHTVDHAHGGATAEDNLAVFCRRHHVLKHQTDWSVVQLGGGRLRWTSPAGRSYVDTPAPVVRFVSDGDPPPF